MPTIAERLGTGLGGPFVDALARVLDARADAIESVVAQIRDGVRIDRDDLPVWALRLASYWLGVERDPAWTRAQWLYCLRLRAKALVSHGTTPEAVEFAKAASPLGLGTADGGPVSKTLYVAGGLDLSTAQVDCLIMEALNAIPDVAGLQIVASSASDTVFTLDVGPGFDVGQLAGTLYP